MKACMALSTVLIAICQIPGVAHGSLGTGDVSQQEDGRTISFVGQRADIDRLIDQSGGWMFVLIVAAAAIVLFALLWILGKRTSENRDKLEKTLSRIARIES